MKAKKTMSPQQRASLGGLAAARRMTPEERTSRARKGAAALIAKYGVEAPKRASMIRHGYNVKPLSEVTK